MADKADLNKQIDAILLGLIKKHQKSPLETIFAQEVALNSLKEVYASYIDSVIPNARCLAALKTGDMPKETERSDQIQLNIETLTKMRISELLKMAYPVVEYDDKGRIKDNRQQAVIDFVSFFSQLELSKTGHFYLIQQAISVFAAISTIQGNLEHMRMALKKGVREEDISSIYLKDPAGGKGDGPYQQYCAALKESFLSGQPEKVQQLFKDVIKDPKFQLSCEPRNAFVSGFRKLTDRLRKAETRSGETDKKEYPRPD